MKKVIAATVTVLLTVLASLSRGVNPRGYITDLLNEYAVEFIKHHHEKPFLVYLALKAIDPEMMHGC